MFGRTAMVLVTATVVSLSPAACGTREQAGVTRAQYIARADRICRATHARAAPLLRRLAARAGTLDAAGLPRLAPLGRRVHEIASRYLLAISRLEQPPGDRDEIGRFLAPSRQAVAAIGEAAAAASAGRPVEVLGRLQEAQTAAAAANAAGAAYGFSDCARALTLG